MTRKTYTGKTITSSGPYSHAVDAGGYVYFSGQTAYNAKDYDGEICDITTQTKKCFAHLEDVMEEAGVSFADVIKVNVYLTGMKYFNDMNNVYQTYFDMPFPARTCVAVYELLLGADVEIECVVKRP